MSNDDSHIPTSIIRLREKQFCEIFDFKNKEINLSRLDSSYIKECMNRLLKCVDNVDIAALPTALLNPFMLKALGISIDAESANTAIASAFSFLKKSLKLAGVIGTSKTLTEPFGETGFSELISGYDEQVGALKDYVDLFILCDIKSMPDLRAAILSCKKAGKEVMAIIESELFENSENTLACALSALKTAEGMGACGFGISFSGDEKEDVLEIIKELTQYSKIPIATDFTKTNAPFINEAAEAGTEVFVFKDSQIDLFEKNKTVVKNPVSHIDDCFIAAHYGSVFFLKADTTEISEPIGCLPDMEETIHSVCETSCDILRVEINTSEDAMDFAKNAHMSILPVMFLSESIIALKTALLLYQGIAVIDSSTLIPKEELEKMCKKYGALIY